MLKNKKNVHFFKFCVQLIFANAQFTQILTSTSIVPTMWTFTWGVETTALYSASLLDDKKDSKQEKRAFFLVNSNSDSHVNSTSHVDLDMRFWDEKIKLAWIFRHIYSIICELVTIKIAKIWDLYGYLFYGMSKFFTLGSALLSSLPKLISRCFHRILKLF